MLKKKIIGCTEVISIPDLQLYDLDAKVDTGADSNAIHCDDIHVDKEGIVHFKLLDEVHTAYHGKKVSVPLYQMKRVKSSNGKVQLRPSIKVKVNFFGKDYMTVISLTDRSDMKYPMLIGRKFLANKFLVDVSQEYLTKQL
ncbi:MAG: clan AA aspartic protease [Sulfurimonas sp. RIFOXYD12_FULL_33_39]|uniref:ATP-dependent zinc protease family protein n=1 Tax=unclassified Sulfurimonas TaxID=2623549 RepID=UPI0008C430EA|nr:MULTISPECIES: RimK/LysX family protein [unclassified Sulfurimonas]OHE04270.1 MAG: clan AA aspartic protease [Sulfurimonas sp. RIFCSPLOWO2_12_FULL_34_6]OHE09609.1 MAG: clan AA aspartic protease [Sulfurimonas sp. RIFOXYD12_FULL_33_39]OHE13884.1 MAG: clan AA aspartic protease [Sulfurimonas sp. RIFOXYD2_FULL_34_21]DAB28527.1 MAG TPA: clan AA aspartic protease [Sulfurimonas sp. UBA10385]